MKKISDFLFKNILWKCLSIVLATLLWLVCVNLVNPVVSKTYTNTLAIKNLNVVESNGYVLLNKDELENQFVIMTVKASHDSFNPINNSHFQPYIDVSPIDYLREENIGTDQPLNIYVERLGPAALSSFSPTSIDSNPLKVNIRLDKVTEVVKPVTVNVVGTAKSSYVALSGQTTPETIKITGPSTVLNRISSVSVEVDVNGVSDDVQVSLSPKIIDIDKRDITNQVTVNLDYVDVKVPVNKYARIPIQQSYTGNVAEGYDITSITKSIQYVEVVGSEEDISSTPYIRLPDLNVSGWTATDSRSFDVRNGLNTKLSVVNGTPNEVVVTVNIKKQLKKEIKLSMDDIRVIGISEDMGASVDLPRGDLSITVKGLPEKISNFNSSMILDASVNIYMIEPGIHDVAVSVLLPQGIYLDGKEPVIKVTITEDRDELPEPGESDLDNTEEDEDFTE